MGVGFVLCALPHQTYPLGLEFWLKFYTHTVCSKSTATVVIF